MAEEQLPAERKPRGAYAVSARLAKVLTLLASGKTQLEACAAVGFTPRALQFALKKQSVKTYMQEVVMHSLGLTAMKAAKRIDELLNSPNEMVAFHSSRYALATGLQIQPPEARSGPVVNIGVMAAAGYVLDLREPEDTRPLPASNVVRLVAASASPVIECQAVTIDEDA
jgi:hypothetical protein